MHIRIYIHSIKKYPSHDVGMAGGPGGGAKFLHAALGSNSNLLELKLYTFEYAKNCGTAWMERNTGITTLFYGDQSSKLDLDKMLKVVGGGLFDIIIDDGSHVNDHQYFTFTVLLPFISMGGLYIVEDIHSSCYDWRQLAPEHRKQNVGGAPDCITQKNGKPTFLARVIQWQKDIIKGNVSAEMADVKHIDLYQEAVVFEKNKLE